MSQTCLRYLRDGAMGTIEKWVGGIYMHRSVRNKTLAGASIIFFTLPQSMLKFSCMKSGSRGESGNRARCHGATDLKVPCAGPT